LDEREKAEIEAIDVALGKIDIGSYGTPYILLTNLFQEKNITV